MSYLITGFSRFSRIDHIAQRGLLASVTYGAVFTPVGLTYCPWPAGHPTRANRTLVGTLVAAVAEVGPGVRGGDAVERGAERPVQLRRGTRGDPAQLGLHLGPGGLDRVEVRRVGGQVAVGEAGPV